MPAGDRLTGAAACLQDSTGNWPGQNEGSISGKHFLRLQLGQRVARGGLSAARRSVGDLFAIAGHDGLGTESRDGLAFKIVQHPAVMQREQQKKK